MSGPGMPDSRPRDPQADPDSPVRQQVPTRHGPARVRLFRPAADPGSGLRPDMSQRAAGPAERGTLLVGHGAGGQRDAADVLTLTELTRDGWTVVLVDQPWRVAGRKVATPPPTLDAAWMDVLTVLTEQGGVLPDGESAQDGAPPGGPLRGGSLPEDELPDNAAPVGQRGADASAVVLPRPWVYAGRSAGARVVCRTSGAAAGPLVPPAAVLCLAFPLHPPGRPDRSRVQELAGPPGAGLPTLVVQGARDPMGSPVEIRQALTEATGTAYPELLSLHEVPGNHSPTRDLATLLTQVRCFLDRVVPPR